MTSSKSRISVSLISTVVHGHDEEDSQSEAEEQGEDEQEEDYLLGPNEWFEEEKEDVQILKEKRKNPIPKRLERI